MASAPTATQTPAARAPSEPAFRRWLLAGCAGPAGVLILVWLLAPAIVEGDAERGLLRSGGSLGVATAVLLSLALGAWMIRACRRGGSAFLLPMAGGFLAKLIVLAIGTWLLYQPLRELGNHVAFAVCFVASVLAFQMVFTPVLGRPRLQPRSSNSSVVH